MDSPSQRLTEPIKHITMYNCSNVWPAVKQYSKKRHAVFFCPNDLDIDSYSRYSEDVPVYEKINFLGQNFQKFNPKQDA